MAWGLGKWSQGLTRYPFFVGGLVVVEDGEIGYQMNDRGRILAMWDPYVAFS